MKARIVLKEYLKEGMSDQELIIENSPQINNSGIILEITTTSTSNTASQERRIFINLEQLKNAILKIEAFVKTE